MKDVDVTMDELTLGKDSLIRSMPGRFETTAQAVDSFASLFVYDLGLDYYSKYIEKVGALDAGAVHAAARKHLIPERMLVVAVGDRQKIEADLVKLNLGAMELRDAEGNVVK
jgi:zinc protease